MSFLYATEFCITTNIETKTRKYLDIFFCSILPKYEKNPEQKMKGNKKKKELGEVHNRNIVTNRDNGENMNGISKVTSYEIIPQIDI